MKQINILKICKKLYLDLAFMFIGGFLIGTSIQSVTDILELAIVLAISFFITLSLILFLISIGKIRWNKSHNRR